MRLLQERWRLPDSRAISDLSRNAADTYLVESRGYFLPDKSSSVPESNPNSEDESESEDTSVTKKGRSTVLVKNGSVNLTVKVSERRIP